MSAHNRGREHRNDQDIYYQIFLDLVNVYGQAFTLLEESDLAQSREGTTLMEERHARFLHMTYIMLHEGIARWASIDISKAHRCYLMMQQMYICRCPRRQHQLLTDHTAILQLLRTNVSSGVIINEVRQMIISIMSTPPSDYDNMVEDTERYAYPSGEDW